MPDDTVQAGAQQRVIAAVVTRGDRMLVSRRPEHKRHGGLWEFPGGKVGDGESDLEAISRELREELDVATVQVAEPVFVIRDPGSPFLIVFVPVEIEGEPKCIEHTEHRWGTLAELLALDLAPGDRSFVETCANR
ncbi:MAG TPA: NUDIX domain-containing protein [Gemmatimonadales bacterium]|nr:NUDIX domain-containing protein [Gemmatimonadales bacterium]